MVSYAKSPGNGGASPATWPIASEVTRDAKQPSLLMFVHPRCPCSRASVGELALLMAHCQGRVRAHVFFLQPAGMTEAWVQTDTWRAVAKIPGVTLHCDVAGREARRFGAETSGDTLLYDAQGRLKFHGGITVSRGHSGDNPGREALQDLLLGKPLNQPTTPVFGCALFDSEAEKSEPSPSTAN